MTCTSPKAPAPDNSAILSEVGALAERIGASRATSVWSSELQLTPISTLEALTAWMAYYRQTILVEQEWPVVLEAWQLTREGKFKDLIRLDKQCDRWMSSMPFHEASRAVGQRQLGRLRALLDQRIILRYLEAIEARRANGWHPVVYGLYLAVFNLPLRQGLVNFGAQTMRGMLRGVCQGPLLTDTQIEDAIEQEVGLLPKSLPELPGERLFLNH